MGFLSLDAHVLDHNLHPELEILAQSQNKTHLSVEFPLILLP